MTHARRLLALALVGFAIAEFQGHAIAGVEPDARSSDDLVAAADPGPDGEKSPLPSKTPAGMTGKMTIGLGFRPRLAKLRVSGGGSLKEPYRVEIPLVAIFYLDLAVGDDDWTTSLERLRARGDSAPSRPGDSTSR